MSGRDFFDAELQLSVLYGPDRQVTALRAFLRISQFPVDQRNWESDILLHDVIHGYGYIPAFEPFSEWKDFLNRGDRQLQLTGSRLNRSLRM